MITRTIAAGKNHFKKLVSLACLLPGFLQLQAQTPAFPGAEGFGRFATGARGAANPSVYVVTNLNDNGPGSFRDAVSQPGRFVVFAVGGIINLQSNVTIAKNVTIAGQTAPGDGIVLFNKRVTFSNASNTICRFLRIRLGATGNSGNDASGLSNGRNIILDHMSITWGMDENFSINWDNKNESPDNITVQNSIIGQGLHRENHSAGGLIQTPDGGKVSLIRNLYISNKTRNPKVKGVNEFVNNVVYNWGNHGNTYGHSQSGDAYIMGGSSGVSEVNILNNYFMSGPLTPPSKTTPFSRGTGTFNVFGSGNFFDNNRNGVLDGAEVPFDATGYPGISGDAFKTQPFPYPAATPAMNAAQAYQWICDSVGAWYPRRDQVDELLVDEVKSKGTKGIYVYRETDLPLTNGGLGTVFGAPAPADTDKDGMPDAWEDANGLDKNNPADAVAFNTAAPQYLNIEVYINGIVKTEPPAFVKPPSALTLSATSNELPTPSSAVTLSWTDNSDNETSFSIERSTDGINFTAVTQTAANATSYTDENALIPNVVYYYRVKALSGTESSAFSNTASVQTPPVPTAPQLASIPAPAHQYQFAGIVNGNITLKWSGSSNTTKYVVFFGTSPTGLQQKAEISYSATPSWEATGLADNTTYYWRVDALNDKGSAVGNVWSFRTAKQIPKGLVGYWSFDETGEGNEVIDSTAYQNHGILGLDDDDQSIRIPGKKKNALDFASADMNRYVVSIPNQDQLFLDKSSFSLSFWMKADASLLPPDNNSSAYLLCKGSISKNDVTGATGKRFNIEFKNKQFRFALDDDNDRNSGPGGKDELQISGTPFFVNDWVHVVAIYDSAARKLRVYNNGTLSGEGNVTKALYGFGEPSALILGNIGEREFLASTNTPSPYKGMLDELRIYNYALSFEEIVTLYYGSPLPQKPASPSYHNTKVDGYSDTLKLTWQGGVNTRKYQLFMGNSTDDLQLVVDSIPVSDAMFPIADPVAGTSVFWRVDAIGVLGTTQGDVWSFSIGYPRGLVAHYALDENTGTVVTDSSVYANHGAIRNLQSMQWIEGKFRNALGFGTNPGISGNLNTDGAIVVPHADQIQFDDGSFTISMWVSLPAYEGYNRYLFHKGSFEANTGKWYGLQLNNRDLTFAIDDGTTKRDVKVTLNSAYDIFGKGWTHILAVRNKEISRIRLYINGVMAVSGDESTVKNSIGQAKDLLIGNSMENRAFRDTLDDVRIYNYALSEAAIQKLANAVPLLEKVSGPTPGNGSADAQPEAVGLSWSDKTGTAVSYNVFFGTAPGNMTMVAKEIADPHFTVDTLQQETTYYWRVQANSDIEKVMGDVWTFTTGKDVTPPEARTKNISVTLNASGSATITADSVNDGSNDVYGILEMGLDKTVFSCEDIGENEVTLTVTDNNGNQQTQTAIVTVEGTKPAAPVISTPATEVCAGDRFELTTTLGADAASLRWLRNGQVITGASSNAVLSYQPGDFRAVAVSAQSCPSDTSNTVTVSFSTDTTLNVSPNVNISKGASVELTATGSAGNVTWSPGIAISTVSGRNVVVNPGISTRYVAKLETTLGCMVERSVWVNVDESFAAQYNKLLTPDGDGINDRLVIKNINGYPNNRLQVFDAAGKLIYQKNGYSNEWDGRVNGRIVSKGTYYIVLSINNEVKIKGSVTVIH